MGISSCNNKPTTDETHTPASTTEKAKVLVEKMTLEEKIDQLPLRVNSLARSAEAPGKHAGFVRVELKPGETKHVSIPVGGRSLSYWDVKTKDWKPAKGA